MKKAVLLLMMLMTSKAHAIQTAEYLCEEAAIKTLAGTLDVPQEDLFTLGRQRNLLQSMGMITENYRISSRTKPFIYSVSMISEDRQTCSLHALKNIRLPGEE